MSTSLVSAAPVFDVWLSANGEGIYRTTFDPATGKLTPAVREFTGKMGSWMAWHPTLAVFYATYREGKNQGVAAFRVSQSGKLEHFDTLFTPHGGVAHIALSSDGELLATAHYSNRAVTVVKIDPQGRFDGEAKALIFPEGTPGPHSRQDQSRPHFGQFSPDGNYFNVVDLGRDKIWTLAVKRTPLGFALDHDFTFAPGSGPRHLALHPSLPVAYVGTELSNELSVLAHDSTAEDFALIEQFPDTAAWVERDGNTTSDVQVHPSGRFAYVGNRGSDTIGVFALDAETGRATLVESAPIHGDWPRGFSLDPTGQWLLVAGQYSATLGVFKIDPQAGTLTYQRPNINVPNVVRVLFGRPSS